MIHMKNSSPTFAADHGCVAPPEKPLALFFEQIIKSLAHIVAVRALRATAAGERHAIVGLEIVAEIGATFVSHVVSLRLAALIVLARIEEAAIFAAMDVGVAMRTFVCTQYFSNDFNFASTVVTNHNFLLKVLRVWND